MNLALILSSKMVKSLASGIIERKSNHFRKIPWDEETNLTRRKAWFLIFRSFER